MNWRQHILFALFFYAVSIATLYSIGAALSFSLVATGAIITLFYGLLPDIDTDKSRVHNMLVPAGLLAAIFLVALYSMHGQQIFLVLFVVLVAAVLMVKFMRHRGIAHTIRFGLIVSLPLFFVSPLHFAFALIAFFSHLLADFQLSF